MLFLGKSSIIRKELTCQWAYYMMDTFKMVFASYSSLKYTLMQRWKSSWNLMSKKIHLEIPVRHSCCVASQRLTKFHWLLTQRGPGRAWGLWGPPLLDWESWGVWLQCSASWSWHPVAYAKWWWYTCYLSDRNTNDLFRNSITCFSVSIPN